MTVIDAPIIDLNEVRMFVQVVRAGSFAGAARHLGVPSNTLSRRVRQLEAALRTRLLQRSTRKLTLTHAGRDFFERCVPALDGLLEAGRLLRDGQERPSGTVRVAAPVDFLDLFQIEWLARFLGAHPEVRLEFVLSDERTDLIADRIDVAFRAGAVDGSCVVYRRISPQSAHLVASPQYLRAHPAPHRLDDLLQHDCLAPASGAAPVVWTLQGPRGVQSVRVHSRLAVNSARNLLRCCLAGLGIALLPEMLIGPHLRAGRLVPLLPGYRREGPGFNVVLPSREHVPRAVLSFIEFAERYLRQLVDEVPSSLQRPRAPGPGHGRGGGSASEPGRRVGPVREAARRAARSARGAEA